jgi:hypothetical protein
MNSEELWAYARTTVLLHAQVTHLIRQIGRARLYLDSLLWADELDEVEIAAVTRRLELYYAALENVWRQLGADLEAEGTEYDPVTFAWPTTLTNALSTFSIWPANIKPTFTFANKRSRWTSKFSGTSSGILNISLEISVMTKSSSTHDNSHISKLSTRCTYKDWRAHNKS